MTTNEAIFEVWAPARGRWSPWVKPVLFACIDQQPGWSPDQLIPPATPELDLSWVPPASGNTGLVLDLPSAEGVTIALSLVGFGFRPVPLYNAVPLPTHVSLLTPLGGPVAVVDVRPILSALGAGTEALRANALAQEAPPVFMLDALRAAGGRAGAPGQFDNRSISFTTDFPSATFLRAHGIERMLLVQRETDPPQADLAHTLRAWQAAGIAIELKRLDLAGPAVPCVIPKPSFFGQLWYRVLAAAGLHSHSLGGYGGFVPIPSAG